MKKSTVSVSYDDEKISAMKVYLKDTTLEEELLKAMDMLYEKHVPSRVREFLCLRAGLPLPEEKPVRKTRAIAKPEEVSHE